MLTRRSPKGPDFEISCWRAQALSAASPPHSCAPPVFCTEEQLWLKPLSFFLHLHLGICKELSQKVCFPRWIMTSNNCSHSLSQKLKSEERLWQGKRAQLSLTEYYYCGPRQSTNLLSHNWEPRRGKSITKWYYRHARDWTFPTAVTFTRWYQSYRKCIYIQISGRNNELQTCTKTS